MLIADGFTGNFATKANEDSRRSKWAADNNCLLPIRPPGGWSACGQPCDAFHFQFRRLANHFIDGTLGSLDLFQLHFSTITNSHVVQSNRRYSGMHVGNIAFPFYPAAYSSNQIEDIRDDNPPNVNARCFFDVSVMRLPSKWLGSGFKACGDWSQWSETS